MKIYMETNVQQEVTARELELVKIMTSYFNLLGIKVTTLINEKTKFRSLIFDTTNVNLKSNYNTPESFRKFFEKEDDFKNWKIKKIEP